MGSTAAKVVFGPGQKPVADLAGRTIGYYRFGVVSGRTDFAAIQLLPGVATNAAVCHFGGPVGIDADVTSAPTVLHHVGWGIGIGDALPARTGIAARGLPSPDRVYAELASSPGDSGGPVLADDGRAVGLLVDLSYDATPQLRDGISVVRLSYPLALTRESLGITLRLLTAPLS